MKIPLYLLKVGDLILYHDTYYQVVAETDWPETLTRALRLIQFDRATGEPLEQPVLWTSLFDFNCELVERPE